MTPLATIAELLRTRIGLDPGAVGPRALAHAVRARTSARGIDGAHAYLAMLEGDPAEWDALLEAIVVPETWFFRDRQPFVLLGRWAARHWLGRDAHDPTVVLSLPCASGEETWSIAIALAAAGLPPAAFRVDGIDLSERALAVARTGVYGTRALRGHHVDPSWKRYLTCCSDGGLEVAPELRPAVHFTRGNLIEASQALAGRRFDCVFSRNLLIYCDPTARAAAIASFAALLRPDGLLVLGHAETLPPHTPGFVREGPPGAFAWRRTDVTLPKSGGGRLARRPRAARPKPSGSVPLARARHKPPPHVVDDVARARALADRGELAAAAALAADRVAAAPDDAAAHALLGIVQAACGHDDAAVEHLRRALYLEPQREDALIHLALVLERRGERAAATRLRSRARRAESAR